MSRYDCWESLFFICRPSGSSTTTELAFAVVGVFGNDSSNGLVAPAIAADGFEDGGNVFVVLVDSERICDQAAEPQRVGR